MIYRCQHPIQYTQSIPQILLQTNVYDYALGDASTLKALMGMKTGENGTAQKEVGIVFLGDHLVIFKAMR